MEERDILDNGISTTVRFNEVFQFAKPEPLTVFRTGFQLLSAISPQLATRLALRLFCTPRQRSKIKSPLVAAEFNAAKIRPFIYRGKKIQVYRFGQSEKKVLLVHGWEGNAADFSRLIPALLASGYEVTTFDGPAHGQSQGSQTNVLEFGEIINGLNLLYGYFDKIIGHSFGGFAASRAVLEYESMKPDTIVTIGSPNALETMLDQYGKLLELKTEVVDGLKDLIEDRFQVDMERMATSHFLSGAPGKKLVVHDLYDKQVPFDRALEIIKIVDHATLHQTAGLGHNRILRHQESIEKVINFLDAETNVAS